MTENENQDFLQNSLQVLVGLPLSIARDAANMKVFHFGAIRRSGRGTAGTHALHIQCPWRIVTENAVVTGRSDRFVEPQEGMEIEDEDHQSGTLERVRLSALLKGYDISTQSFLNATDQLVVVSVTSDKYGGADISLTGGYRLQIFPDCSLEEDWRFIEVEGRHVVVEGGKAPAGE